MNPTDQLSQYILKMAEITPKGGNFTLDLHTADILVNRETLVDTELITNAWEKSLEKNAMTIIENPTYGGRALHWKFHVLADFEINEKLRKLRSLEALTKEEKTSEFTWHIGDDDDE